MARSRSLGLLGKSTSKTKNGVIPTSDVWRGIHFLQDVTQPAESLQEHNERVMSREHTPFIAKSSQLSSRFAPVRDKFVEKYEPLLKESERRNGILELAKKSREYALKQKDYDERKKKASDSLVNVRGLPPNMPMKSDENMWGQMQKMIMRDGRVYNLDHVLLKIREMRESETDDTKDNENDITISDQQQQ